MCRQEILLPYNDVLPCSKVPTPVEEVVSSEFVGQLDIVQPAIGNAGLGPRDFRTRYLQKLTHNKVWIPAVDRPPKHQNVIIFDWDDTLLCTSYLSENEGNIQCSEEVHLRKLADETKKLLESAIAHGHTFIVTNAMTGWVEQSAAKWAPELLPILGKVRIISARAKYSQLYPSDVDMWKVQAFLDLQREFDSTLITNLIALGDADYEMHAARVMGNQFEQGLVKTIKFRQRPTPVEHLKEVELICRKFDKLVSAPRHMKIQLERR